MKTAPTARHPWHPQASLRLRVANDLIIIRITGADTQDAYSIFEIVSLPQGGPSGLHSHPQQQTLYIIEGVFVISMVPRAALQTLRISSGAIVHIPAGVPHTFKNVGVSPGRLLAILAPAGLEHFLAEVGEPAPDLKAVPRPSNSHQVERIASVMQRYNIRSITSPADCDLQ
jgi:quercetin dioxygenase-like cupin family protein